MNQIVRWIIVGLSVMVGTTPTIVRAHCDTLDGPVVIAAREALAASDVTPVLKWVKPADEAAIRDAFEKTVTVRKESKTAAELADTWFFETLVRVHRAGEGAPYTGLKTEVTEEPGIAAADRALVAGRVDDVLAETADPLKAALKAKFQRVMTLKPHAQHSVDAGREYVEAYVDYIHCAERIARLAESSSAAPHAEHAH